jgi:hypothetical protein
MKRRYRVKVSSADGVEETQFIPLADTTPRIRTRYVRDPTQHGKYKDGREYAIDPEKVEDEAEEALADSPESGEQRAQERAAEKGAKRATKKGKK